MTPPGRRPDGRSAEEIADLDRIEMIRAEQINGAYERMLKGDVTSA